jgi:hypothetical protein
VLSVRVFFVLAAFLLAAAVFGFLIAPRSNVGFADDAAVLAFAALIAVGIERILELTWTLLGQSRLGGWWPLKQLAEVFDTVEKESNALLGPLVAQTQEALKAARQGLGAGTDLAKKIDTTLADLQTQKDTYQKKFDTAHKLAPGSERLALLAQISTDFSKLLTDATDVASKTSQDAKDAIKKAEEAVGLSMTVAESFTDNPARRVASILIGGGLGMIAAGFLGLNIFSAVLGAQAGWLAAGLGIILTGFVIGLGSSPVHEVVKALQNYKESHGEMIETGTSGDGKIIRAPMRNRGRDLRDLDVADATDMSDTRTFRLRRA